MSLPTLGTCAVCGVAGYLTTKGLRRAHVAPAAPGHEPTVSRCPGTGKPGTPVERTVGR